jgi:3-isopropylmalate dehydrogenase
MANPLAAILSFAMCLRYSLGEASAADLLEECVRSVLTRGIRTADLMGSSAPVSTSAMTDAVLDELVARSTLG